jgi:branched-subunit amino acid transport protein AzlD
LRALPFTVLAHLRSSTAVDYLSARMPLGVMVILLAYSLRSMPLADPVRALPDILALAATLGLHLWRRNAVLSILGGTAIHVALATALLLSDGDEPTAIGNTRMKTCGQDGAGRDGLIRRRMSGRWRAGTMRGQRPLYSSSVTCSPQSISGRSPAGVASVMDKWVMKWPGAAPCQCHSSAGV